MSTPYPLSPAMARFVEKTLSLSVDASDMDTQRRGYSRMCKAFTPERPPELEIQDSTVAGVPVRFYRPQPLSAEQLLPCLIYAHGGGWVVGDLDSHDFLTARLAADLGCVVIAVDYRLAPEHPFPAGFEDCLAAWRFVQRNGPSLAIDPLRMAIAGDSAGGNLAAAVCLALRDAGERQPAGQALIYPALGGADDLPSRLDCADAPLLSTAEMVFYLNAYLQDGEPSAYALPLQATDFRELAPAFIAVAQFDPLRDDGVSYEKALREAGVSTEFDAGLGLVHSCLRGIGQVPEVDALYQHLVSALSVFLSRRDPH